MKINLQQNILTVLGQLDRTELEVRRATREALNRTAEWAETYVRKEMRSAFDRPVPYTLRSLRVFYASTAKLQATLWFRQRRQDEDKLWAVPQIKGGERALKPMELRLQRAGILPPGWLIVPGAAAPLDSYGNMSQGEISRILNVLGSYKEAGYNKANDKTAARLRRGNAKKGQYGFAYWVNPVSGPGRRPHLLPGVYRRVYTSFGTSLKPMMIFVSRAQYRMRLDFFGIVRKAADKHFPAEFDKAMKSLLATGSASAVRRGRAG